MTKNKSISIRVDDEWIAIVDEAAKRLVGYPAVKWTRSDVLMMAVLEFMEQHEDLHERLVEWHSED